MGVTTHLVCGCDMYCYGVVLFVRYAVLAELVEIQGVYCIHHHTTLLIRLGLEPGLLLANHHYILVHINLNTSA